MQQRSLGKRIIVLIVMLVVVAVLFGVRLVELQIVNGQGYFDKANYNATFSKPISAARGEILDRNGVAFATNRIGFNVVMDKNYLPKDFSETILKIRDILAQKNEKITDTLPIVFGGATFSFEQGSDEDVAALKTKLGLQTYATINDVISALIERYGLQNYSGYDLRVLMGVRYEMTKRLFSENNTFTIANDVSIDTVTKIKENSMFLPGVTISEETVRIYPLGDLAAQIIGVTGPIYENEYEMLKTQGYAMADLVGKNGIEKALESVLKGQNGESKIVKNKSGSILVAQEYKTPVAGNSVYLTIDAALQRVAQDALANRIKEIKAMHSSYGGSDAEGASVVAIDVTSGEVLAMVSYPSYDLSSYYTNYASLVTDALKPLTNRSLTGQYSVGSSFKPVVALAAADLGLLNRNTAVSCSGVYTFYTGYSPKCGGVHGSINVVSALKVSCNIFFYEMGRRMGIDNIVKYASQLGFAQETGIELPEKTGTLSSPSYSESMGKTWYAGNVVQAAIGQLDTTATPLQLAVYTSTLANGGSRYQAHLVDRIMSFDASRLIEEKQSAVTAKSTAGAEAFALVREGMIAASHTGGTSAGTFNSYPVNVASKTGTPQTTSGSNSGTYISYAPAEDPKIAVVIVGEKVGAGYLLAPIAKAIYDQYFGYK